MYRVEIDKQQYVDALRELRQLDCRFISCSWSLHADSSCDSNLFRKVGGRHGMVFGYVSPKAVHLAPLVPGIVPRLWPVCLLVVDEEWIGRGC